MNNNIKDFKYMNKEFYMLFPKRATVWRELSWSRYRLLMRVEKSLAENPDVIAFAWAND